MSLAVVHSRARLGIDALKVLVEIHLSNGLPALNIVGMPETAVRESKDRVRSAILNAGFEFPTRRITVNLAPADLPKEGGRFDLPIALGILIASGQLPEHALDGYECLGELSLSGDIRAVTGVLPAVMAAAQDHRKILVPHGSLEESSACTAATVFGAATLQAATAHLNGSQPLPAKVNTVHPPPLPVLTNDLCHVQGHFQARRALEVAAVGGHGLLFSGAPGTGKTMLAHCLPGILPRLTEPEALEVASLYSLSGHSLPIWQQPPWRAPHHTASCVALTGGGSHPRPGEISLAHRGVLFLDELPEFDRRTLEILRQPLESGEIMISRARQQVTFPARFQLLAAMNPCPCGFLGDKDKPCTCRAEQIQRYRRKLSGPLMDRIDMQVEVGRLPPRALLEQAQSCAENSQTVRERVENVRRHCLQRQNCLNAELATEKLTQHTQLQPSERALMEAIATKMHLSGRALHRLLKVSRTLADLEYADHINRNHILEAASLRFQSQERLP